MAEKTVLAKFDLRIKPTPKKEKKVLVRMPVKIQTQLIDRRDSGYNRNDLKMRLLKGRKKIPKSVTKPVPKKVKPALSVKVKGKIKGKIKLGEKPITKLEKREERRETIDEALIQIDDKLLQTRLPEKEPKVLLRASSYYMNNREFFINFINSLFGPYRDNILQDMTNVSCERGNRDFSLLTHQKIVRDYINHYSPYRGLLLYHGLGSGKTCSSIAIAEGLKSEKQVWIMTPASLEMNYVEELKKCGDKLFRFNQFWEFIKIAKDSPLESAIARGLSIPIRYIKKYGGAWVVDVRKKSNYTSLSQDDKNSLDAQINKMILSKYKFIRYNGLREKWLKTVTRSGRIKNPFNNKIIVIDEAHNFVSRIVNKMKKKDSLSMKLYELI